MKSAQFTIVSVIAAECFYLSRGVGPGQVSKVRVHGHAHHLTVDITEFVSLVTECNDFCRADERTAKKNKIKLKIKSRVSILLIKFRCSSTENVCLDN